MNQRPLITQQNLEEDTKQQIRQLPGYSHMDSMDIDVLLQLLQHPARDLHKIVSKGQMKQMALKLMSDLTAQKLLVAQLKLKIKELEKPKKGQLLSDSAIASICSYASFQSETVEDVCRRVERNSMVLNGLAVE